MMERVAASFELSTLKTVNDRGELLIKLPYVKPWDMNNFNMRYPGRISGGRVVAAFARELGYQG